jgi:hypothetical protein
MAIEHIKALNLAKEGKWNEAHELVQPYYDRSACLIHGYLHRVEGDLRNARYWYKRANEALPENTLEEELKRLYEVVNSG